VPDRKERYMSRHRAPTRPEQSPIRGRGAHRPGRSGDPVAPNCRRELWLTGGALMVTCSLAALVGVLLAIDFGRAVADGHLVRAVLTAVAGLAIAVLIYGGLVYQLARWGHYRRLLAAQLVV
jgi:hypothetical protein